MGNDQSNEQARDFFYNVGGKIEKGFDTTMNVFSAPARLMDSMGKFLQSPNSMILPVIALGGLYIVMQFKK